MDRYVRFDAAAVSGGEKPRIAIARALARGTPTILVDEPISVLDVASEERTIDMLMANARALVPITHRPSVVAKADYVIHLDGDGRVRMNLSQILGEGPATVGGKFPNLNNLSKVSISQAPVRLFEGIAWSAPKPPWPQPYPRGAKVGERFTEPARCHLVKQHGDLE
tara:strand:- start:4152 stop:4652 length:501 start_codon:yes stop_codon:yes gene_type:complete